MATLSLVAGIAGAGVSAVGAIEQGQAQARAADYQAQVAANNEQIAKQNAEAAAQAGQANAEQQALKAAEATARVRGAIAANGVNVNDGSALDVQSSQRISGQLDTENVLHQAALSSYGYRTQATNYKAQSDLDTMEAEQAPIGAAFSAAGGLLSSASSIGGKWLSPSAPAASAAAPPTVYSGGGIGRM